MSKRDNETAHDRRADSTLMRLLTGDIGALLALIAIVSTVAFLSVNHQRRFAEEQRGFAERQLYVNRIQFALPTS